MLVAGCGLFSGKEDDETVGWSAQRLYGEAKDAMRSATTPLQSLRLADSG